MLKDILFSTAAIRCLLPKALVRHYSLPIALLADLSLPEYTLTFPLRKVPVLFSLHQQHLSEVAAILFYLNSLASNRDNLVPADTTANSYFQVIRWLSFFTSEYVPALALCFKQLDGRLPYNRPQYDDSLSKIAVMSLMLEHHLLLHNGFLVEPNHITMADLFGASCALRGFNFFFDAAWRKDHPITTSWFLNVTSSPILKDDFAAFQFINKAHELAPQ
ncbi:glutathione S-transferase [Ascoidea rubescens DSM 1968]|uniref:Glutathione S-transferase n=1 Tax=Ascoidea rubescens DSM 1968 TaxID=1344418 RepID=A0A1D2VE07_9ASCO|nr:glutathione S-transferase [Ascoidea rubescens DSM 1968]ODV59924.1 glutathione S-transferase [Ascoidea rubescens DSM 1968]